MKFISFNYMISCIFQYFNIDLNVKDFFVPSFYLFLIFTNKFTITSNCSSTLSLTYNILLLNKSLCLYNRINSFLDVDKLYKLRTVNDNKRKMIQSTYVNDDSIPLQRLYFYSKEGQFWYGCFTWLYPFCYSLLRPGDFFTALSLSKI